MSNRKGPTREIIVGQLRTGPKKWRELEGACAREGVKRSTFHYNLKKLIGEGLVQRAKAEDGLSIYSLSTAPVEEGKLVELCISLIEHEDTYRKSLGLKLLRKLFGVYGVWNGKIEDFYQEGVFPQPNAFPEALRVALDYAGPSYKVGPHIERFLSKNVDTLIGIVEDKNIGLELRRELLRLLVELKLPKDEKTWLFRLFESDEFSELHEEIRKTMFTLHHRYGLEILERLNLMLDHEKLRGRAKEALDHLLDMIR